VVVLKLAQQLKFTLKSMDAVGVKAFFDSNPHFGAVCHPRFIDSAKAAVANDTGNLVMVDDNMRVEQLQGKAQRPATVAAEFGAGFIFGSATAAVPLIKTDEHT
jgi:hypothetical protein